MVSKDRQQTATSDREIITRRTFDAPRELVFKMWTNREHIERWWGPDGFTTTTHEMDVRAGGVWRFIMHGPDGTDYPNRISYREVTPPERLVYDHGDDTNPKQFEARIEFHEYQGKTRLEMHSVFPTADAREYVIREFHAIEGGNQTLDRLGAHVAAQPAAR